MDSASAMDLLEQLRLRVVERCREALARRSEFSRAIEEAEAELAAIDAALDALRRAP